MNKFVIDSIGLFSAVSYWLRTHHWELQDVRSEGPEVVHARAVAVPTDSRLCLPFEARTEKQQWAFWEVSLCANFLSIVLCTHSIRNCCGLGFVVLVLIRLQMHLKIKCVWTIFANGRTNLVICVVFARKIVALYVHRLIVISLQISDSKLCVNTLTSHYAANVDS